MKKPNFFQRLRLAFRYSLSSELNWLLGINGATSYSGVSVSETSALQLGAVFAAVRLISKTIASLPLNIYKRRDDGGKDKFSNHYLYPVLHDSPNREMTSFELREIITGHLTTWGNAYGEIVWGNDGRVKELWPLRPDHMKVERKNQELVYTYFLPDKQPFIFPPGLIWHLRGFSQDGLKGLSVISMARESIGLGLATEEFGSRYFGSGAAPDAVLIHPGKLTPEAVGSLKKSWEDQHKGLSKSHRIAILQEGLTYQQIGIPPEDSQFLQTRQFQVREIARIFEVPPHMIGDLSDATFSNIEEQSIEFVVNCIRPWCVRIEQSINKFLLSGSDNRDYFAEFLIDGLLRGNIQSRYTAYATAIQNGIFSPNDVLELENRNPYDGGDQHFIQLNMQPVEQIGQRFIRDLLKSKEIESILNGKELIQIPSTEIRSSLSRKKLANAYKPIFEDIAARIIRSEKKNVLAAAKKFLARRDKGQFDAWLDDFYKEHKDYIKSNMLPAFRSYGEAISAVAAQEINSKKEFDDSQSEWIKKTPQEFVEMFFN